MRVLLVVNDSVRRQEIVAVLRTLHPVALLGEAADGTFAVWLGRAICPDTIIMEIAMPTLVAVEATRMIYAENPSIRVIGLAIGQPPARVRAMMDAGAMACVSSEHALVTVLTALARRERPRDGEAH
jgi:DNA-binding NarL/FixJ family response regulator